jgi:hypothetical protein
VRFFPLEITQTIALGTTGILGSVSIGPSLRGEAWQVNLVTCSLVADTAPIRMDVYVAGVRVDGTYSAHSDVSDSTYSIVAGQQMMFTWAAGTSVPPGTGAAATVTVRGTRSVP